jgi:tRNA (uracil-5-)-methyltransferase
MADAGLPAEADAPPHAGAAADDSAAAAAAAAAPVPDGIPSAKRQRVDAAPLDGAAGGTAIVRNLPRGWDAAALRAAVAATGAKAASVRKDRGWAHGFVTFGFLADRLAAEAGLSQLSPAGKPLRVADAAPRVGAAAAAKPPPGGAAAAAAARARRDVRDAVSPLWALPYAAQLARKRATVTAALTQLTRNVRRACGRAQPPAWAARAGPACELEGILRSPVLHGYRNKCDFSIGPDAAGALCVGFNVGAFADGYAAVAAPGACPHVSPAAQAVAAWAQAHLRRASALPAWDKRAGAGFWRLLLVREGGLARAAGAPWRAWLAQQAEVDAAEAAQAAEQQAAAAAPPDGAPPVGAPPPPADEPLPVWEGSPAPRSGAEVLLLIQVDPSGREEATVRAECAALAAALRAAAAAASPPLPLGALLLQLHAGCSNAAPEDAPCMAMDAYVAPDAAPGSAAAAPAPADGALHETLLGLRFRVSPTAFCQTNTAGAEALYDVVGEWAAGGAPADGAPADGAPADATLYDVCCGAGTIGLSLARRFAAVVGVDICAPAVADAVANAVRAGAVNATFHAGRAEDVLPPLLRAAAARAGGGGAAVAVVDPPRAGLHRSVLAALLAAPGLDRLVYVSCNVDSLAVDAAALCAPGAHPGAPRPFVPRRALAVDLFPHTKHVEAVLLLERAAA